MLINSSSHKLSLTLTQNQQFDHLYRCIVGREKGNRRGCFCWFQAAASHRWLNSTSTTFGSARVERSPRSFSLRAICRRIRLIIFPESVRVKKEEGETDEEGSSGRLGVGLKSRLSCYLNVFLGELEHFEWSLVWQLVRFSLSLVKRHRKGISAVQNTPGLKLNPIVGFAQLPEIWLLSFKGVCASTSGSLWAMRQLHHLLKAALNSGALKRL